MDFDFALIHPNTHTDTPSCIHSVELWSFVQLKRDWEAEKWIDYKNELFPTACDLPVSVGLCYHIVHWQYVSEGAFFAKQKIVSQIQMNHILWRCSPYPNICVDEHMWIDSPRPKFMCVAWIKSIHANEIANEMKWNGKNNYFTLFNTHQRSISQ